MDDAEQPSSGSSTDPLQERAFEFVLDSSQQGVRSHAMREYWKKRHSRKGEEKPGTQRLRTLLPVGLHQSSAVQPAPVLQSQPNDMPDSPAVPVTQSNEAVGGQLSSTSASSRMSLVSTSAANSDEAMVASRLSDSDASSDTPPGVPGSAAGLGGIPTQALTGMEHALGAGRLDPFDMFPVTLTAQHHKLLHHWLSAHATMMFEPLTVSSNPMRDVWFPLDLSNAASFNAIMAHAAAHLARQQGVPLSFEALQFKFEAVRIVNVWMAHAVLALSDQAFAAVIRLLTYERYWGTAAEWQVHRDGLQRMIAARGGFAALQSNWQLGLVTYLVSLMAKPSWFHAANKITGLAALPAALADAPPPPTPVDHHALATLDAPVAARERLLRGLWLLSSVQDTHTLMVSARACSSGGRLAACAALQDALRLLLADLKQDLTARPGGEALADPAMPTEHERVRLASIVLLCILMRASVEADGAGGAGGADPTDLVLVDVHLQDTRPLWPSATALHSILFGRAAALPGGDRRTLYAENMIVVLLSFSSDARRGVQKCLLRILCEALAIPNAHLWDESWTPDAVLASLRGS